MGLLNNTKLKIVAATSIAIFSLAVCFTGVFAWFESKVVSEENADKFNIIAMNDVTISDEYKIYEYDFDKSQGVLTTDMELHGYDCFIEKNNALNRKYVFIDIAFPNGIPSPTYLNIDIEATLTNFFDKTVTNETWVLDNKVDLPATAISSTIRFTSNHSNYAGMQIKSSGIEYHVTDQQFDLVHDGKDWIDTAYRSISFDVSPTGDLLTWLENNATKTTPIAKYISNFIQFKYLENKNGLIDVTKTPSEVFAACYAKFNEITALDKFVVSTTTGDKKNIANNTAIPLPASPSGYSTTLIIEYTYNQQLIDAFKNNSGLIYDVTYFKDKTNIDFAPDIKQIKLTLKKEGSN